MCVWNCEWESGGRHFIYTIEFIHISCLSQWLSCKLYTRNRFDNTHIIFKVLKKRASIWQNGAGWRFPPSSSRTRGPRPFFFPGKESIFLTFFFLVSDTFFVVFSHLLLWKPGRLALRPRLQSAAITRDRNGPGPHHFASGPVPGPARQKPGPVAVPNFYDENWILIEQR